MEASNSRRMDWILFLVSTAITLIMLVVANEWFWLALPFSLTYLAKGLDVL